MRYWTRVLVNTILFIAISGLLPGLFHVDGILVAFMASIVLSILNVLVKPILHILSFPITFLTLGLFSLVINGIMLELTSIFVSSGSTFPNVTFGFSGLGAAIVVAFILSIANTIIGNQFSRERY
ncbi:phage holin family protein [Latilactobacillus sakei]|uniref:phage holin family protein n=1 Tax=Latilactobacillus sakei TaxID=1599 RepID=UPI0038874B33